MHLRFCLPFFLFALVVAPTVRAADAKATRTAMQVKPRPPGKFGLLDGDRVAFIGDTLVERMQSNDYIETALTMRYPDRNITFRNLGWSGDTVFGDSRASFGTTADGFQQLRDRVSDFKPTVVFLGYGGGHSFDGAAGLPRFLPGMETLVVMLSETKPAIVVLSPIRHEDLGRPLPDPVPHNRNRALYRDALRQFAAARGFPFVDLFDLLGDGTKTNPPRPLTDNGIHLSAFGYWRTAAAIERGLELSESKWTVELGDDGKPSKSSGTKLTNIETTATGVQFTAIDDRLPFPAAPPRFRDGIKESLRTLHVRGLPPGVYAVKVDDRLVQAVKLNDSDVPVLAHLFVGPEFVQVEKLRQIALAKNELFFHRWRPQNETYLLGFRKHEQGQNAREISAFDSLISEQEAAISKLRVPVAHKYEIVRVP
ncbi:MAG: SGNH/GDSL hydrolase family protein [Planctomycetales bacterium]|nr:SGNH/GDSL hydrolase family protein [Planctomycetales bacterium]